MGEPRQDELKRWKGPPPRGVALQQSLIHPAALVDAGAVVHETAEIGAGAIVGPDVSIGPRVKVGPHAVLTGHTTLEADVRVYAGAVIGEEPQDNSYGGERSYVRIGPRTRIREYVTIHRGTLPESETVIGADCFLMALSHVGHNSRLDDGVTLGNAALLAGYVTVGEGAFLSGMAGIHQFVRIGRRAIVAGATRATRDVPPFCMAVGNRLIGFNLIGLRRAGVERATLVELRRLYDAIAKRTEPFARCVASLLQSATTEFGREFLESLANPGKRGVCPFDPRK